MKLFISNIKLTSFIAAILLIATPSYAHHFTVGGIYYNIIGGNETNVEVTYYGGNFNASPDRYSGTCNIPSTVTHSGIKYTVCSIGDWAFFNCKNLTHATLPSSIKRIGGNAFNNCSGLTSITLSDSITVIDMRAFEYCTNLKSITIPNSVTTINYNAFSNCHSLTSISIPESVSEIGISAFSNCINLKSINISGKVSHLNKKLFQNCTNLASVSIPNSITSIKNQVFAGCSSLTSITLPNSVISIGSEAFFNCSNLTSIIIPDSVTTIGDNVFGNCSNLTSIRLPNSLTSIGSYAFTDCSKLNSITIPNSVTNLGDNFLYNTQWHNNQPNGILYLDNCCLGYKGDAPSGKIKIAESTRLIGNNAFSECEDIVSITFPKSLEIIGEYSFHKCVGLTVVTIPSSVKSIGSFAFNDCINLQTLNFFARNCTRMGDYTGNIFGNCHFKAINIENGVKTIPSSYAFNGCKTEFLKIPESMTYFPSSSMQANVCYIYRPTPPPGGTCTINRLFVPKGSLISFAMANEWCEANQIIEFDTYDSDKCTLTFAYPEGGTIAQNVSNGQSIELQITPTNGWECNSITFNGTDVTNQLDANGIYITPPITCDSDLRVVFIQKDNSVTNIQLNPYLKVFVNNKTISIVGASESSLTEIYSTSGIKVYNGFEKTITLDHDGIYILKTEGHTFKFAL